MNIFKYRIKALSIAFLSNNVLLRIIFWTIIASLVLWTVVYLRWKYKEQQTIWTYSKFLLDIQQKNVGK